MSQSTVWFHGVSVGEVHLLRSLVRAFHVSDPSAKIVISSTTNTGLAEARNCFPEFVVVRFPFDFTWNVRRALQSLRPRLVVLAESELWPNFLSVMSAAAVPVVVVNGRMSPRSAKRLTWFAPLVRPLLLNRVRCFAMQTEAYAERLLALGVPRERIRVTGSIKFDGALNSANSDSSLRLRELLGLADSATPVLLAGSTHHPEEAVLLDIFRELRETYPDLQLILVPRSPERFDVVWQLIQQTRFKDRAVRRSQIKEPLKSEAAIVLLDTIGELSAAWNLATVGFTGGSLDGRRGGQSMIEPASLGVPVVFGPYVWNFKDVAENLVACGGAKQVRKPSELLSCLKQWLADPESRRAVGQAAKLFVQSQRGAVERTLEALKPFLNDAEPR